MIISSWGAVPDYLEKGGAEVFLADTEAWASYKTNGEIIKTRIADVLAQTNSEKINIIAHSKGGIDARYAISAFDLGAQIASLTTIGSPHRGSYVADFVVDQLTDNADVLYEIVDCLGRLMGDKKPETQDAAKELTRDAMREFNTRYPNVPGVYYQSYGVQMTSPLNDPLFAATHLLLNEEEGANDGMISIESYRWGEFQGVIESKIPGVGLSHLQITGSIRDVIAGVNIPMLYVDWVSRLKEKGF
jgi:triacylglycerol esterase/lipase EstA (alpha/beta hydrolase family)